MNKATIAALKRAGISIPEGAKATKARVRKAKPTLGPRLSDDSLIAGFSVPVRPVPWKAPTTTRSGHAFKDARLVAWQKEVSKHAKTAMCGQIPYTHPVRLDMTFYLKRRGGTPPDLSNLNKSAEDALQGQVFVNDTKVCDIVSKRVIGDIDGATIRVYSTGDDI